jgi:hypothetical protein
MAAGMLLMAIVAFLVNPFQPPAFFIIAAFLIWGALRRESNERSRGAEKGTNPKVRL